MTIAKPDPPAYRTASFRLPECTKAHNHHPIQVSHHSRPVRRPYIRLYAVDSTLIFQRVALPLLSSSFDHVRRTTRPVLHLPRPIGTTHHLITTLPPRSRGAATCLTSPREVVRSFTPNRYVIHSVDLHPPQHSALGYQVDTNIRVYTREGTRTECKHWRHPLVTHTASRTSRQLEPCFFIVITPWHPHQRRRRRSAQLRVSSQPTCHDADIIDSTVVTFLLSFVVKAV